jgi:hypothetical protein
MGVKGDALYNEQMARAWLGTLSFIAAAALGLGSGEDDPIEITGGGFIYGKNEQRKMQGQGRMPNYGLRIGRFKMNYLNIPGLAIPLALIGSMNERMRDPATDEATLQALMQLVVLDAGSMVSDLSVVSGLRNFVEFAAKLSESDHRNSAYLTRYAMQTYGGFYSRPIPTNWNLVRQIEQLFDPAQTDNRSLRAAAYATMGIHPITNEKAIDLFGKEFTSYPGQYLMPLSHWAGKAGKDPMYDLLAKYTAIPSPIRRTEKYWMDGEIRQLTDKEFADYARLAGSKFYEALQDWAFKNDYRLESLVENRMNEEGEDGTVARAVKTQVQMAISQLASASRAEARQELFME